VDEEIRPVVEHRRVGPHSAARFVDAPALPRRIARPEKRNGTPVVRGGAEMADLTLADNVR
jgi:hypothetical protein